MYNIYKLIDPLTEEIMYVGATKTSIHARLSGHIHEAYYRKREFSRKQEWIRDLFNKGYIPRVELIKTTEDLEEEKLFINKYKPFLNIVHTFHKDNFDRLSKLFSKPTYQYGLDGNFIKKWESALRASEYLKISSENISSVANGFRKQAGGFMWRFVKYNSIKPYAKNKFTKEVHRYNLDGEYVDSFDSAMSVELLGFSRKLISQCCTGNKKTHKGFKFSFVKSLRYSPNLLEIGDGESGSN